MQQLNWNMCLLHLSWFLNIIAEDDTLRIEEPSYRDMSRTGALAHILESANTARLEELGLGEPDLVRWTDVAYGLQSMAREYEPNGMVDSIDVFHAIPLKVAAASREEWLEQHLSKWRGFCRTEPRFHEVEGAHYTMIGPEHVAGFASKLKAALKGRGL
jgi:thioesterase domain-containing protein